MYLYVEYLAIKGIGKGENTVVKWIDGKNS
jgi:hypothetical protein